MRFLSQTLLLLLLMASATFACACSGERCIEINQWQIGVAVGLGIKSNPLTDGDNIPLVIVPDIAWYGEAAYFDNGELGYQWLDRVDSGFVTFLEFDSERAYFSFWHPTNILAPIRSSSIVSGPQQDYLLSGPEKLAFDKVGRRNWALMAGGRWYYHHDNDEWELGLSRDISGTHQGEKLTLRYQYSWFHSDFSVKTDFSLVWKSSDLLDYYYGVDKADNVDPFFYYHAKGGWQPSVSLSIQKAISDNWQWLSKMSYQVLNSGMTRSPIVDEKNIYSIFSGFAYRF